MHSFVPPRLLVIIAGLYALLCTPVACATKYYLSASGHDDAAGTSAKHPWQTLKRLQQVTLRGGDQVWLHGDHTFVGGLSINAIRATARQPLAIRSYGQGRAIINAGIGDGLFFRNCSGVLVSHIELVGAGYPANRGTGVRVLNTLPGAVQLPYVRIRHCRAHGFGKEGFYVGSSNYGPLLLPDGSPEVPPDGSQSGFSDVSIEHCTAYDNVYYGILVTGVWNADARTYANRNVTIRHCRAYANPGDPAFMANHSGSGILLDNVQHGRIDRCIAYTNGYRCNARVGGPCGIWTHSADHVVISRCIAVNNRTGQGLDGAGFDFDAGVSNSVMHHNISGFNDGAGYLLYVYASAPHHFSNNHVHHNISVNDGRKNDYAGLFIRDDGAGIRHLRVDHNRVYQTPSANHQSSGILLWHTTDATLTNNVLVSAGQVPLLRIRPNHERLRIRHNTYWSQTNAIRIEGTIRTNNTDTTAIPVFDNVRTWSKKTGYERRNGLFTARLGKPNLGWITKVQRLARQYR